MRSVDNVTFLVDIAERSHDGVDVRSDHRSRADPFAIQHPSQKSVRIGVREDRGLGVGQFINDGVSLAVKDVSYNKHGIMHASVWAKRVQTYTNVSRQLANVSFKRGSPEWCLYATRDVNEGEELFLHYGSEYWITQIFLASEYPMEKLVLTLSSADATLIDGDNTRCETYIRSLGLRMDGPMFQHLKLDRRTSAKQKLSILIDSCKAD